MLPPRPWSEMSPTLGSASVMRMMRFSVSAGLASMQAWQLFISAVAAGCRGVGEGALGQADAQTQALSLLEAEAMQAVQAEHSAEPAPGQQPNPGAHPAAGQRPGWWRTCPSHPGQSAVQAAQGGTPAWNRGTSRRFQHCLIMMMEGELE